MKNLAAQKRLLISQAELHRQIVRFERVLLQQRVHATRERFQANRWWLVGGGLAASWLIARKLPRIAGLLPVVVPALKMIRSSLAK